MAATDQYNRVGLEPPIARVSPDREMDIGAIPRASVKRQTFAGLFAIPENGGCLDRSALSLGIHGPARFHSGWLTRIFHLLAARVAGHGTSLLVGGLIGCCLSFARGLLLLLVGGCLRADGQR